MLVNTLIKITWWAGKTFKNRRQELTFTHHHTNQMRVRKIKAKEKEVDKLHLLRFHLLNLLNLTKHQEHHQLTQSSSMRTPKQCIGVHSALTAEQLSMICMHLISWHIRGQMFKRLVSQNYLQWWKVQKTDLKRKFTIKFKFQNLIINSIIFYPSLC